MTRFFIDMPLVAGKICMIKKVDVMIVDFIRLSLYDVSYGLSLDPDDPGLSLVAGDNRMFVVGRWVRFQNSGVGFQVIENNPVQYQFPEGLPCPYTRLPFFIQHSNNNATTCSYRVSVFFTLEKVSKVDLAIAVVRRGRGGAP